MIGTECDLSYSEIAALSGTEASEYVTMLAARGNAFNYLLDKKLREIGPSLNELMQYLYVNYGLTGIQYTQSDISSILKAITGQSFDTLFDTYLLTNAPLTSELDGSFIFLE